MNRGTESANQLNGLKYVLKSSDPDDIPNFVLRECAAGLYDPVSHIFNASGVFPENERPPIISPIFKSEARTYIANYRPMAKQSSSPKLLEELIYHQYLKLSKILL